MGNRRFLGALGALLLITSPVSAVFTDNARFLAARNILGIILLALWVAGGPRLKLSPQTRFRARAALIGLAAVAVAIAFNLLVGRFAHPIDLTRERLRSLSTTSISVIAALPSGVTLTTATPLPALTTALLDRYRNSGARISVRYAAGEATLSLDGLNRKTPLALPLLEANATGEQEFTRALQRLTAQSAVELLYLVGHGEPPLTSIAAAPALANEGFTLRPYDLGRVETVSPPNAVLVLVAPRQPLPPREVAMLDAHLANGGRLLYFAEPGDNAGLGALLEAYGLILEEGTVNDSRFDRTRPTLILAPFLGKHPITEALEGARVRPVFLTTRALTLLRGSVRASPLVLTGPDASVRSSSDTPLRQGQLVLAAASPDEEPRLVVFGDSDVLGEMFALNHDLVLNAFTWLAGRELLPTLRPKDPALSTLLMSGSTVQALRIVVIDVIPILFVAIGLYVGRRRAK